MERSKASGALNGFVSAEQVQLHLHHWSGGDPQALDSLVQHHLRESALFIDHDLLVERTLGRVAFALARGDDSPIDDTLLAETIGGAAKELLAEDRALVADSAQARLDLELEQAGDRFSYIIDGVGVAESRAGITSVAYNALARRTRRAFRFVVVEDQPRDTLVGGEWATEDELRDDVLTALEVLVGKERTGR